MLPLPTISAAAGEEYPPLSALNDLLFCERRCYLHRVEGLWQENVHTVSGSREHRRTHLEQDRLEGRVRMVRGLWVVSHRLRVAGVCDVVEFHQADDGSEQPFLVEYKHGRKRKWDNNEVQLCAQAMALEEMLSCHIPAGALFFVKTRRRQEVAFNEPLRAKTTEAAKRLHTIVHQGATPPPVLHPKCKQCSLHDVCLPELLSQPTSYQRAAAQLFRVTDM